MQRRIDSLKGHFIICAYGRVGRAVAREFEAEGVPFVVIDVKEELEERMQSDGVLYLIGDPSSEAVLRQAGIERAHGLVCAVDSDAANVYITLSARALNPDIFITARAGEPESPERLYRAGANRVISPYVTSGRHMALLTLRPRVVDYLEVAGARGLRLEEVVIEAGSPLAGRELGEVAGEAVPVLLRRATGETIANPSPNETLQAGDLLLLYGEPKVLRPVEGG
ncbi:MAG: NAD-binding protein [Actinomycetota bacterium]|nr:NAD-binding protein [Actinomycetota bacterium]